MNGGDPSSAARKLALVTGASGGIGADLARVLAAHGHDVALVARSAEKLAALADELGRAGAPRRPLAIPLDLGQPDAGEKLGGALAAAGAQVTMLINNAGFGLAGEVAELDPTEQLAIIDLNIRALTDFTLRFLPEIRAAKGHIMNVASTAAFFPGPGMAIYYATKAYVLSFSQALAQELKRSGVTVTALCPGPTSTGFVERARMNSALFDVMRPMRALDVAKAGYAGMMAGRRVVVPGLANKVLTAGSGLLPKSVLLPAIARLQKQRKI